MSDKQPLIATPSAPPPPYNPQPEPPYPPGPPAGGAAYPPPPAYPTGPPPPLTPPGYGTTTSTHNTNVTVIQAQPVAQPRVFIPRPPNYIVQSVVVLVAFCWLFGLIALISALQVDSAWQSGDYVRARRLSNTARGWNYAGVIVGGIVFLVVVVSVIGSYAASG